MCSVQTAQDGRVCFVGELDIASAETLERIVGERLETGGTSIVVDLSATTFLDSFGARAVIRAARSCAQRSARWQLCCDPSNVRITKVLDLLGLPFAPVQNSPCVAEEAALNPHPDS